MEVHGGVIGKQFVEGGLNHIMPEAMSYYVEPVEFQHDYAEASEQGLIHAENDRVFRPFDIHLQQQITGGCEIRNGAAEISNR